jgi:hypothetical protein
MMVKFYMDEHIPWAITNGLRNREVDVLTVHDDGRDGADDPALMDRATELGRVLVTMDRDFFAHTSQRLAGGKRFSGIVSIPRRLSYRESIDDLELMAKCSEAEEWTDHLTRLPL